MLNRTNHSELLVEEHYDALLRYALRLSRSETDAQDLTQQTFYIWALKGHQLRDRAKVKSWLFTTLRRQFLVAGRRKAAFPSEPLEEVSESLLCTQKSSDLQHDRPAALNALAQLDQIYQSAVSLFYLNDFSLREVAGQLKLPVGTVKSRIARGRDQLRGLLQS